MSKVTVAEKLSAIGNNMARVYDTGFEKGHDQGFEEGKQFGDYAQGFEEGKQAEYDAFWDAYQPTTALVSYQFSSLAWNDGSFFPKKDMIGVGNIYGAFYAFGVTDLVKRLNDCGVIIDTSKGTMIGALFRYAYSLTTVPKISCVSASNIASAFGDCNLLKTIECLEVHENLTYDATFVNCRELENIAFEGVIGNNINFQWSTELTETSIRSIITHLSDTASGKTLTLSKVAVDNAFMYSGWEGGDVPGTAEDNPFWPQLRDSKPNWTITLV